MYSLQQQSGEGDLKMFLACLTVQFESGDLMKLTSLRVNKH